MKLVSRSAWGARGYRLPSGATLYSGSQRRGVKLHYLGTAYSDRAHDRCDDYVRSLQASHMDGNGWSDIGYSFMVCTHGYVYEGRGLRRRNSANGNTALNEQDYAVLLLVGSSGLTQPTDAQLHGARDAIDYCRREGPAGTWVGGHRDGYATSCPGEAVYAWAKKGAPRPGGTATPSTPSEEDDMPTADEIAAAVEKRLLRTDGKYKAPTSAADYNPDPKSSRHWWSGQTWYEATVNAVRSTEAKVDALAAKVDQLERTGMTDAQADALADRLLDKMSGRLDN